jgi:hypothetical protein
MPTICTPALQRCRHTFAAVESCAQRFIRRQVSKYPTHRVVVAAVAWFLAGTVLHGVAGGGFEGVLPSLHAAVVAAAAFGVRSAALCIALRSTLPRIAEGIAAAWRLCAQRSKAAVVDWAVHALVACCVLGVVVAAWQRPAVALVIAATAARGAVLASCRWLLQPQHVVVRRGGHWLLAAVWAVASLSLSSSQSLAAAVVGLSTAEAIASSAAITVVADVLPRAPETQTRVATLLRTSVAHVVKSLLMLAATATIAVSVFFIFGGRYAT